MNIVDFQTESILVLKANIQMLLFCTHIVWAKHPSFQNGRLTVIRPKIISLTQLIKNIKSNRKAFAKFPHYSNCSIHTSFTTKKFPYSDFPMDRSF